MEVIQDWATFLSQHASPLYLQPVYSIFNAVRAYLLPLATEIVDKVSNKPDLATLALLLFTFWISLKILGFFYGLVMYWIRMAVRLVFLFSLLLAVVYVATRGVDGAVEDAQHWAGIWMSEYKRYQDQVEQVKEWQRQQQPVGHRYGSGYPRGRYGWR